MFSYICQAGMWRGPQFLALGGGGTMWNVESLSSLTKGSSDIEAIKEAGFAGSRAGEESRLQRLATG